MLVWRALCIYMIAPRQECTQQDRDRPITSFIRTVFKFSMGQFLLAHQLIALVRPCCQPLSRRLDCPFGCLHLAAYAVPQSLEEIALTSAAGHASLVASTCRALGFILSTCVSRYLENDIIGKLAPAQHYADFPVVVYRHEGHADRTWQISMHVKHGDPSKLIAAFPVHIATPTDQGE